MHISYFTTVLYSFECQVILVETVSPITPINNDTLHPNISGLLFLVLRGSQYDLRRKSFSDDEMYIKGVICDLVKNLTWYCRDRVSSCNIYAVQQDTQSVFNEWVLFIIYVSSTYFGPHWSIFRSVFLSYVWKCSNEIFNFFFVKNCDISRVYKKILMW